MYKASDAQYNCSPPRALCSACSQAAIPPPPSQLPKLYTEHDIIWYRISPWLVQVSYPGCVLSQLLVRINSIPAEPRTPEESFSMLNWHF